MTRQEFLTLQLAALDALKSKRLIKGLYENKKGSCCAVGALLRFVTPQTDLDLNACLLNRITRLNDDGPPKESPAARFVRVRSWVAAQLGGES